MLVKRLLVGIILLPVGLIVIYLGGLIFTAFVALLLGLASWEYVQLFRASGLRPAAVLVVGGGVLLVLGRAFNGFESAPMIITLLVFTSMAHHLIAYERGCQHAATDFSVTLAGALYAGWLGAYMISLRNLPAGTWWLLVVFTGVWLADTGAYTIGSRFGRRQFSPRLSPKKTWEGFLGGVVFATIGGALFAQVWSLAAGPEAGITPWAGGGIGLLLAVLTPLGDLGESMIKRQAGLKDSGKILPGHGGMFDRVDSWLWAAPIGYYAILFWFIR